MSRFYDALKQAGGSDASSNGHPVEEQRELPGNGIHISAAASTGNGNASAPGAAAATAVAPTLDTETADPWVISPEREPLRERRTHHRKASLESLAKVAVDRKARVIPNAVDPSVIEHYRRLRTKIMQYHAARPFRSLLVTSAAPQEGKTVTVLNLALSFAMLPSFRVLVVDGDIRRGTLGRLLSSTERPGLTNVIDGSATLTDVFFECDDVPLRFLGRGTSQLPAAELLHSSELSGHFRSMTEQFDLVLVDSPPVNVLTDTQLLAANCDAVLLVTRAFRHRKRPWKTQCRILLPSA